MRTIISNNEKETFELGKSMARDARPGQVICLDGDLGAGKTVFTKGFAQGLGIEEIINSPTFTIVHEHEGGRLTLYHFDVYRIEDPGEMYEIGLDEYLNGEGVCLIEWSQLIADLIPADAIKITINRNYQQGENSRQIIIDGEV